MPTDPRADVLAAPHELERRRVYAKSDDLRRRIVEIEDALASKPSKRSDRVALADERETLIARNGFDWEPELATIAQTRTFGTYGLNGVELELGFVSEVEAYADRLTDLDALADTSCYSLSLTMVDTKHLERLLASRLLPRLRRLRLHVVAVAPALVLELLRAVELEQLGLDNLVITAELAEAIAAMPGLRELSLATPPGSGSLSGTSAAPLGKLTELRSLSLSGQDLDAKLLAKLLDAPFVPKLERLAIRHHKLGARGCKLLGGAELTALRELDLTSSNVGQHATEFAASPKLAKLESLDLDASKLGAKHLPAFLARLDLPSLRVLDLSGLRFKETGAEAIAASDALARCGVTSLAISGNALGDDGAEALANAEGLAGIRRLRVSHNGIRADGVAALADSPLLRDLEALDIQSNKIQTKGAIALAGSIVQKTLRAIAIDHNWIGNKGAAALFGRNGLTALEHASFGYENNFEDAGLEALADSDIRLRTLIAYRQGGPEALQRYLESPAAERLTRLHSFVTVPDEVVGALTSGELGPKLHTLYVGNMEGSGGRCDALHRRFAFTIQRGNGRPVVDLD